MAKNNTARLVIVMMIFMIIIIGALAVSGAILIPRYGTNTGTSLGNTVVGCDAPLDYVRIKGDFSVIDIATFGVEPRVSDVEINSIRSVGSLTVGAGDIKPFGFTRENYDWEAELIDTVSGNLISTDSGSNTHEGGSNVIQKNEFTLNVNIPDKNCDGVVDSAKFKVKVTISPENQLPSEKSSSEFDVGGK